jgi:glutathione S-transferase
MSNVDGGTLYVGFALVCALLVLKAQLLGAATAATRGRLKRFINPEDADWLGGDHVDSDDEQVHRVFRAHRNDLENLLPFFVGGTLYVLSGASAIAGLAYFGLFAFARYAHSYAYLTHRARLRRDAFTVGWLVTILLSIHAAWVALSTARV